MDTKIYQVNEQNTLIEVMKQMGDVGSQILYVTRDGILQAAVSDGDIRRWILSKGELSAKIKEVANYHPIYIKQDVSRQKAMDIMKEKKITSIPIVDDELRILDICYWHDGVKKSISNTLDIPVVMMAGGLGTRLYPYTNILPKPLIPIGDIPISQRIIQQFAAYGCKDFHMIVNYKKNMIKAYYNEIEKDYNVFFVDEDTPLGTGGGLSLLKGKIDKTFVLTNCDILINADFAEIYKYHKEKNNVVTMVCSLQHFSVPYGVVEIDENGQIESMKEKPSMSFLTNTGCYIVEKEIIDDLEENVAIGFPDIIARYQEAGRNVGVFPISENDWQDMGQLDELEKMREKLAENV